MDKRFFYSFAIFLVFTGLPIGVFMLSVATYPDSEFTVWMIGNFNYVIISLFVVTNVLIGGVFYFYSKESSNRTRRRSE
jgi:hypothetical protein